MSVAIVDDDPGACAGMARLLRAVGMSVDTYASAEALLAAPRLDSYDGLVLDVRLGGMSGLELYRQLGLRKLAIPAVFVSAHDDPQTRSDAERLGCAAFFGKTEPGSRVIEALREGASRYRGSEAPGRIDMAGMIGPGKEPPAPSAHPELREPIVAAVALLADAARPLRVLKAIDWPVEARARFLARKGKDLPVVAYEPIDPGRTLRRVERARRVATGHATIDAWLMRHADAIEATARMLEAVGTAGFYTHGRTLYGDSSTPLRLHPATPLDMARSIHDSIDKLARIRIEPTGGASHSATQVARTIRKALAERFGADAPAVTIVPKLSANALATSKEIRIRRDARFTDRDAQQLLQHEAWIHCGTSINGKHQDLLPILGVGYPYTTRTQEGLAVFAEVVSATIELDRFRRLADRVVAIQMAVDGADFREVYRWFLERVGQPEQAYENTRRVYRGGVLTGGAPFTKDVSYLFGLLQVGNVMRAMFAAGRADVLKLLFCGKLDVQDLPALCELAAMGLCRAPRNVPPWISDPRSLLATLTYSAFTSQIDPTPLARYAEQLLADSPVVAFKVAAAS